MSKEKPEVGDVFSYKHYKMHVIAVQEDVHCVFLVTDDWKYWIAETFVFAECSYLGKSETNIQQLFEVQDD